MQPAVPSVPFRDLQENLNLSSQTRRIIRAPPRSEGLLVENEEVPVVENEMVRETPPLFRKRPTAEGYGAGGSGDRLNPLV